MQQIGPTRSYAGVILPFLSFNSPVPTPNPNCPLSVENLRSPWLLRPKRRCSCFYHHFFFEGTIVGMQVRAATTTILYDKVLRLSLGSLGQV